MNMPMIWTGRQADKPCFFSPDDPKNVIGDAPDGFSWAVRTADGFPVCGFVANEPKGKWAYTLDPRWAYAKA